MSRRATLGFTLMELTIVMVIAGILSVFAISRINTQSFDTEGYANQVAAAIRYAQKTAISQRRNVAVTIAAGSVSLTYPDIGSPVHLPPGTGPFTLAAKSGVTVAGASFIFNSAGKPSAGGTVTITGDVARTITIEAETGHVH